MTDPLTQRRERNAQHAERLKDLFAKTPAERFAECVKSCDPTPEEVAAAWAEWEAMGGRI